MLCHGSETFKRYVSLGFFVLLGLNESLLKGKGKIKPTSTASIQKIC